MKTDAFSMYCTCQFPHSTLQKTTLNDFAALGRETVNAVRMFVKYLLVTNTPILQNDKQLRTQVVVDAVDETVGVQMHLPFETRDFTDFLNSRVVCSMFSLQVRLDVDVVDIACQEYALYVGDAD